MSRGANGLGHVLRPSTCSSTVVQFCSEGRQVPFGFPEPVLISVSYRPFYVSCHERQNAFAWLNHFDCSAQRALLDIGPQLFQLRNF